MKALPSIDSHSFVTAASSLQAQPPRLLARMVTLGICVLLALAVLFASLAQIDVVVSTQGKVIPSGKSKVVQPLEPGVVRRIAVRDGQAVKAGDVLLELDPTSSGADRERLQQETWVAEGDLLRLEAQLAGRASFEAPPEMPEEVVLHQRALLQSRLAEQRARLAALDADAGRRRAEMETIASQVTQLQQSLPLIRRKHAMREELAESGHIAQTGVIETQLELINGEKELAVQKSRLKEAQASHHAAVEQRAQAVAEFRARVGMELVDAMKRRDGSHQEFVKAHQRWSLQTLRAPIDGVVQQLAVSTVGGVVTAAQPLLTVVPEQSPLEVEAMVANRDIGHLRVGQRVINKIETFDFTRYGYIEGEVQWVGTDAMADPKQGLIYPVRIKLASTQTPTSVNGRPGVVTAGMNVSADIRTGERRLIEYLLAPLLRYQQEALRER
jgi:hemolysin D